MSQLATNPEHSHPPSLPIVKQWEEAKEILPFVDQQYLTTLDRAGEVTPIFHNIPTLRGAQ